VERALKNSDLRYFRLKYPYMTISWNLLSREVWNNPKHIVPSLFALCLRKQSAYHWALGTTNGRPHIYAMMANLYPRKLAKATLSVARTVVKDQQAPPLEFIGEAIDHMYRLMKIDLSEKTHVPFSLKPLEGMYLGASAGFTNQKAYEIPVSKDMPHPVKVSGRGKKADHFDQYMNQILEFLRTGVEPPVFWTLPPKNENAQTFSKQMDDALWAATLDKLRVFNIPSGIYIMLERVCCYFRHMKERGWAIRIGHKWGRGGADSIAQCLGVDSTNCWSPEFVEGDVEKFDQAVLEVFVNLYYSTMLIHHAPGEDKDIFEKVNKFLLKVMLNRITKIFGDVWVTIKGGVPSGSYNTSDIDSWVMLLYFCLFCVWQIAMAPPEHQEELELVFLAILRIVVYGDDHVYRKGLGIASHYFSGAAFADFLLKHFNVKLRDIKDGIPFVSVTKDGWIMREGVTFLKHQFIINPEKGAGQSKFLPFRESREVMIRAIWGRETRFRDEVDVLLSIIGHAYGTYAANPDAYDRLNLLYKEIVGVIGVENLGSRLVERVGHDDLKKLRQLGISEEDILSGFPAWETLVSRNVRDEAYQDISSLAFDTLDPVDLD